MRQNSREQGGFGIMGIVGLAGGKGGTGRDAICPPTLTRRSFVGAILAVASAGLSLMGCAGPGSLSAADGVSAVRARGRLKCGVKTDVPGYGYQDPATGTFRGMEIDICYEIAARLFSVTAVEAQERGLVDFTGVTAKTRGPLVDSGQVDLVCATYTITEERKRSWNFTDPYYTDSIGMLVLKSSGLKTLADLDGRIVGVGEGANTKKLMQQMLKDQGLGDISVSYPQYLDYPTLAAALASGNIDVFAIDRSILGGYFNDSNELLEPDLVFGEQRYGVCTNKQATELSDLCDEVVARMVSDGSIDALAERYGLL